MKYITTNPLWRFDGNLYKINAGKNRGVYTEILKRCVEQLDSIRSHHNKVFALFLGIHLKTYTEDNKIISELFNSLTRRLKVHYGLKRVGYIWCREHNKNVADAQHYHIALFLDGSKINYPHTAIELTRSIWKELVDGFVHIPDHCFYHFKRSNDAAFEKVIYRLSYLAKSNTKGDRSIYTNDFGTSRLKTKQAEC